MLAAARKELILQRLRTAGRIIAKETAVELGVSEDSIRRDLRELDAAGLAVRVYGGALPASPAVADYATRTTVATESKRRIATRAIELIDPGSTIILDGGTTTLAMVEALPRDFPCAIITHSPTIAGALLDHDADVFLIGGQLLKHSAVACGATAVEAASRIGADIFFLGVTGVHPSAGLTTGDPEEAAMKRALASRAADTYVLGSQEKLGVASRHTVLPFDAITAVISDLPADEQLSRDLASAGALLI
ncbi:DeoR/GlpR family DNA-binding transcription regulator [Schumannella sp. 10F1B-5-1]|uniref:DeoR/GlpR family DNA-binding transcription regulator n=1 Tax=Schumannella sp. 10F1B-5-1 TaxID=2590780 RepID=UPI00113279B7|nr:DeoR/GlpR family DNA-binding transcription regulator [Schumannella sp. 10F1B-5-1]TPW70179.1 DeoR/GlpR transcriptional regulator [Schumannella sp. 10F1B-5-1]